jgi:hypothetical protein
MWDISHSVKKLPIGEKGAKQKKPRPSNNGGFVNQGES